MIREMFGSLCVAVFALEKPQKSRTKPCVFLSKTTIFLFSQSEIFEKKIIILIAASLSFFDVSRKNEEIISNFFITPRFSFKIIIIVILAHTSSVSFLFDILVVLH